MDASGGAFPAVTPVSLPAILAANVLDGFLTGVATAAAATILTVPAGRTWIGNVMISTTATESAAGVATGRTAGVISVLGAGSTPPAGNLGQVSCQAGANAAGGTVGSDGSNTGTIRVVIIAPAGNSVALQGAITITGSSGECSFSAIGELQ